MSLPFFAPFSVVQSDWQKEEKYLSNHISVCMGCPSVMWLGCPNQKEPGNSSHVLSKLLVWLAIMISKNDNNGGRFRN